MSASYYALFQLLVDEATRLMLAGKARAPLHVSLARAFNYTAMKDGAAAFAENPIAPRFSAGLNGESVQDPLVDVANAFIELHEARHDADYNRARRFARQETLDHVD